MTSGTQDNYYVELLQNKMTKAIEDFKPDMIFYNAGSDCLIGDPLGGNGRYHYCFFKRFIL